MAQELREWIDKWKCMKLKSFCTEKEIPTRPKKWPIEWEEIFDTYTYDEGLISRTQKTKLPNNQWPKKEIGE
jgi:hypothetical protein